MSTPHSTRALSLAVVLVATLGASGTSWAGQKVCVFDPIGTRAVSYTHLTLPTSDLV